MTLRRLLHALDDSRLPRAAAVDGGERGRGEREPLPVRLPRPRPRVIGRVGG